MDFTDLLKFDEFLSDLKTTPTEAFLKDNTYLKALASGSGPLAHGSDFQKWLNKNWPLLKDRQELRSADGNVKDAANSLQMALKDPEGFGQGIPLDRWVQNLLDWMEKFVAEANKFLAQMADERFTYKGLKVSNPDRLPEPVVRYLLGAIDYATALFKKRGVTTLLDKTLDKVVLRHPTPADSDDIGSQQSGRSVVSGWFHWSPSGGTVTLLSNIVDQKGSRFLSEWVNEVFLHEVGHHVHLSLLDRQARKDWDAGWAPVTEAKEAEDKIRKVQPDERKRYWDMLVAAKGDLKKIKLKGLDRMKFHAWLASPQTGNSMVVPKQLRWSKNADWDREFLADPEAFFRSPDHGGFTDGQEIEQKVGHRWRQIKSKLGVSKDDDTLAWPILSLEQVKEYAAADNLVEKALDALEVPSHYARTNEKEDFAETFVAYMDAPEALSKQAKYRMQRALWLSGFAGKPIMKVVAKLVAEARALMAKSIDLENWGLEGLPVGAPVTLYHGTTKTFSSFDLSKSRDELVNAYYGAGIFLTPDMGVAWDYARANRNIGFEPGLIDDLKKVNRKAAAFLHELYTKGDKAWDLIDIDRLGVEPGQPYMDAVSALVGGADVNTLADVCRWIIGSKLKSTSTNDEPVMFFSQSTGMPDYAYDWLDELGLDSKKYRPKVYTVKAKATNVLVTESKAEARAAKSRGFDCVVFYGSDLVDGVPEVAIFNENNVKITRVEVDD